MYWIVYKTTCKVNNKIYCGVHKQENPDVFDGYYGNGISYPSGLFRAHRPIYPFHFAFAKYGKDNFYRETIAIFDNPKEAYALEAEIVNPEFIYREDTYNIALGGHGSMVSTKGYVYVFDCTGVFVDKFTCRQDAADKLQIDLSVVANGLGRKTATKGYLFSWTPEIDLSEYKISPRFKHYYLYDYNGDFVLEVNNYKELKAFLEPKGSISNLTRCIKQGYSCCGYFISENCVEHFEIIHKPR